MTRNDAPPIDEAIKLIQPLLDLVVREQWEELATLSRGGLSAAELRDSARSYPATLKSDPVESAKSIRIDPVEEHNWLVDMNLCSAEEGRTQLALRCVLEKEGDTFVAIPWDLLVR